MSIPNFQAEPNNPNPITLIRLERTITRLATLWGYDGDPLADRIPQARTQGDLFAAHDLMQSLPAEIRNIDCDLTLRMCQAAVFGSTGTDNNTLPPNLPSSKLSQSKLAHERSRYRSRGVR